MPEQTTYGKLRPGGLGRNKVAKLINITSPRYKKALVAVSEEDAMMG